jgi:hypothetical protein
MDKNDKMRQLSEEADHIEKQRFLDWAGEKWDSMTPERLAELQQAFDEMFAVFIAMNKKFRIMNSEAAILAAQFQDAVLNKCLEDSRVAQFERIRDFFRRISGAELAPETKITPEEFASVGKFNA